MADYDGARARGDGRRRSATSGSPAAGSVDAGDADAVAALLAEHRCDVLMNAVDPRFVMPLFRAALAGGATYLDMAMSLSPPAPGEPLHARPG